MKVLLFYAPTFWFKTFQKVLDDAGDLDQEKTCHEAVVVFYHLEEEDVARKANVLAKFVKNIKWLAGKFNSRTVVLHSFNHLSLSKAPPEFAREVVVTPFGYLNEWKIHVAGESLAKVFKDL
jgi:hypothetical protein